MIIPCPKCGVMPQVMTQGIFCNCPPPNVFVSDNTKENRYLTPEEQGTLHMALRRSAKVVTTTARPTATEIAQVLREYLQLTYGERTVYISPESIDEAARAIAEMWREGKLAAYERGGVGEGV